MVCLGLGLACGEHGESSDDDRDGAAEELSLASLQQAQNAAGETQVAWASAVEEAIAVGAGYEEVQRTLENFGPVSFSFEDHVLRQEYEDLFGEPRHKSFIDFHFSENRLTCYSVGSEFLLPSLRPIAGDICQFRPGRTTLEELIGILGAPEFVCEDTASFQVRVLDSPVSYYAVIERADLSQLLLTDLVTDLRTFDVSGRLLLAPVCNRLRRVSSDPLPFRF